MSELFFLDELERNAQGLASGVRLAHPFLLDPVEGADAVLRSLQTAFAALDQKIVSSLVFQGESAAAVAWKSGPRDREIQGVTLAVMNPEGWINELRIALRPVQFLTPWRERLRIRLSAEAGPELPSPSMHSETIDPAEPIDPRLPLPLNDHAVFHGPAFVRPVKGADAVRRVLGHARAVYGECEYGPVLRNGDHVLRAFTSNLPLEILSIAHLDAGGCVDEWSAFMQPWPSMILFLERLQACLDGYLDASFYETPNNPSRADNMTAKSMV